MDTASPAEIADGCGWRDTGAEAIMAEQIQARGTRGVVAAAAPTAALIGAEALRAGGNAYDAVVAAALAETVLLPPKCGLAGDLIALAWHRGKAAPENLLAVGGAPHGLAEEVERAGVLERTGPHSVGVPGAPAGYAALAERGRLPLDRLTRPAIEIAEQGFAWSRICSVLAEESRELVARHNPEGTRYYPRSRVIPPGSITRLPGLARALEHFAAAPGSFLAGPVGEAIVARVRECGGVLCRQDLALARAEWVPAVQGHLGNKTLYVTPAPTHGPSLVDAVQAGTGGAAEIHASVMKAIARRRAELADPSGTSMVSAVDGEGTMVTVVHSNSYPHFGSGIVVGAYDLILSNRAGRGFSAEPGHPNFPEPGRRPATTLHAWAVEGGVCRFVGGTPGGANQMPWNAQTLARLAGGEGDIGCLIAAPRWAWETDDDSIVAEEGFAPAELATLQSAAPRLSLVGRWGLRSAMQIVAHDERTGVVSAAADPRTVGVALAL